MICRSLRCERIGEPSTICSACCCAGTNMLHSCPICVCSDMTMLSRRRVDRRIGHLRELLAEIIVERAHLVREHRHRRVVAHRAYRLALILGEHADDLVALLGRDVEHLLEQRERVAIERLGREARIDEIGLQVAHALLEPRLVRVAALRADRRRASCPSARPVCRSSASISPGPSLPLRTTSSGW